MAVKALAARLGLEAASPGSQALRSGFLTSAVARGFQAGRSVAAQEHRHAAGLRSGRRDFQAPCRGRLAVRSLFRASPVVGPACEVLLLNRHAREISHLQ